jgi:alpha-beta hydrolase superfamily lysophospholipase
MIDFSEHVILVKTSTSTYEKADYDIYYRIFTPKTDIIADIVLISGFCANVTHYTEISYYLAEKGFRVITLDPPGFGLSSGLRGGLDNYDNDDINYTFTTTLPVYHQVIKAVLEDVYNKTKIDKPKISLGDSFGGFISLYYQHFKSTTMDDLDKNFFIGNIITNPVISINNPNYNFFERFLITVKLKSGNLYLYDIENLKNYNLVSDLDRRFELFHSPLKSLNYIDYKLFLKVFKDKTMFNGKYLGTFNKQFCKNLLIFQSKNDFLSDYNDLKTKFDTFEVENKTLIEFENYGHFILLEKNWKMIADQIVEWVNGVV